MTGGLIQLAAYGIQDIFLTRDPQITFFKVVYRRHTNFTVESMKQFFIHQPDWGRKASCVISRNGDLMGKTTLVVELPKIKQFVNEFGIDNITKFAWVRRIGYALIKEIEIEIGGQIVDRHYGEWLSIWSELTTRPEPGFDRMIGDIPELYNYTNGKDTLTLYIPLQFWFCRSHGLAIPLASLLYSEVKINVEFNDFDKCHLISPTHYIETEDDIVSFTKNEYLEQFLDQNNDNIPAGQFSSFDIVNKKLYYRKITRNLFSSHPEVANISPIDKRKTIYSQLPEYDKFAIVGNISGAFATPKFGTTPKTHVYNKLRSFTIPNCYFLVDYIFLDEEERIKFANSRHDYLIEQLQIINERTAESSLSKINLNLIQPSKLLVWVAQQGFLQDTNNNDHFNYTDSFKYSLSGKQQGLSLTNLEIIKFNGRNRLEGASYATLRQYEYFNYAQAYQHFKYSPREGVNIYSLCLFPTEVYPSGTANFSKIDNVSLHLLTTAIITTSNNAKIRGYSLGYNILRVISGISGVVFDR